MKKVFLIHGFGGSPNGGWRPYLMAELEKLDVYACALPMPSPDAPKLGEWLEEISRVAAREQPEDIYLVGHSLGVPAILHFLERTHEKIGGAVLVAGPSQILDAESSLKDETTIKVSRFLEAGFDFDKIKKASGHFAVIHGDNDEKVPLTHAEFLRTNLGCSMISIKNGGHLNGSSGWLKLPEALEALKRMMGL